MSINSLKRNETGNSFSLLVYFFLSILYLETLLRYLTLNILITPVFIYLVLFGIGFAILLFIFSCLFHEKVNKIISFILSFLLSFLFAAQLVYFKIFKTFMIVYSVGNANDVMEFANEAFYAIYENGFFVLLFFIPFVALIILNQKSKIKFKLSKKSFIPLFGIIIATHLFALFLINTGDTKTNSPYNLYYNIHQPEFAVQNLGMLTYLRLDVQRGLFQWMPRGVVAVEDTANILKQIQKIEAKKNKYPVMEQNEPKHSYNSMNIDFEALINSEGDETLKQMHMYFGMLPPSKRNEYTARFKDYNLIFITAEGFSHLGVNKEITPTLYKMIHEGFYFKNFYTPIWGVSTTDGEYVATTGLIPKTGVWSYSESRNNYMPFAMGNQLRLLGYTTNAYHNHTYTYYDRHLTHPNMGYDYKGVGNGLVIKETWPESDVEMIDVTIPEFIDKIPFHTYYMTVSGHLSYTFSRNYIAFKNKGLVKDLPYSDNARAYIAAQVELDRALELLLEKLEEKGLADKTLIALSADHYPYGLTQKETDELARHKVDNDFEMYKNAFILYTKDMTPITIDAPSSSLDILPTLSNLMGVEYDSRLLMGRDLFSTTNPLVIFSNRSFITNLGRYDSRTGEFIQSEVSKPLSEKEVDDYVKNLTKLIDQKFFYSTKILEYDYYNKVLGK
ncbi:MAG: sulfatase-like hydrolase/transferase [Tissierellia bacterium]|nr:sulfatase-like hydrolase/transferase [Tissierellia bacterium]